MKERASKCLNVTTVIFGVIILLSLVFYTFKSQNQIILIKFNWWKIGVFLNSWVIVFGWFKLKELFKQTEELSKQTKINTEQNRIIIKQNKTILEKDKINKENVQDMKLLINALVEQNADNHENLVNISKNTRVLFLEAIDEVKQKIDEKA